MVSELSLLKNITKHLTTPPEFSGWRARERGVVKDVDTFPWCAQQKDAPKAASTLLKEHPVEESVLVRFFFQNSYFCFG